MAIVQEIAGHGNPAMTRHYYHMDQAAAQKAIDTLPAIGQSDESSQIAGLRQSEDTLIITPERLLQLLPNYTIKAIGRIFGVSDTTIRKRMAQYGINKLRKRLQTGMLSDLQIGEIRKTYEKANESMTMKLQILWVLPFLLFLTGCCSHSTPHGKELAQWLQKNFRITDIMLSDDLPGGHYWAGVARIGDDFYLISSELDSESMRWVKYLGKDLIVTKPKAANGRFEVSYRDRAGGPEQQASVPFGDIFGYRPTTESKKILLGDKLSTKYGAGNFEKAHDPVIENFIQTIKRLVFNDDAAAIAGMIRYTVVVSLPYGKEYRQHTIRNAEDFKENYHLIFRPEIKEKVLQLKDDDFFCNYKGICVGRGLFWLAPNGEEGVLIYAL